MDILINKNGVQIDPHGPSNTSPTVTRGYDLIHEVLKQDFHGTHHGDYVQNPHDRLED
jgi:hypothetical protein